eukprot:1581730-Alexandrium_andersonii.AAC.1
MGSWKSPGSTAEPSAPEPTAASIARAPAPVDTGAAREPEQGPRKRGARQRECGDHFCRCAVCQSE